MDGRALTEYRGERVIDGSFWYFITKDRYVGLPLLPNHSNDDVIWIDYGDDDNFMRSVSGNFLETVAPENIYDMMDYGFEYMSKLHTQKKDYQQSQDIAESAGFLTNKGKVSTISSSVLIDYVNNFILNLLQNNTMTKRAGA